MNGALLSVDPSRIEPSQIRRVTEQVLARPAFDEARAGVFERVIDAVFDWLGRLVDRLAQGDDGAIIGTVALALVIGAIIVITVTLLRRVRRDRGVGAPSADIDGRSAQTWRDLARQAEADGAYDIALRCTYRALLAELVDASVTDEVAGRTARDYLRDVTDAAPATGRPLLFVTDAFEATWYDRRPVDADDIAAVRSAADEVRRRALVTQ